MNSISFREKISKEVSGPSKVQTYDLSTIKALMMGYYLLQHGSNIGDDAEISADFDPQKGEISIIIKK